MRIDLKAGTRFGRLVITGEREVRILKNGQHVVLEKCVCDCGNTKWIRRGNLSSGTKSCGCLWMETIKKRNSTHKMAGTRIFRIFSGIKTRCTNSNDETYKNYGARGIKCERGTFEDFYKDMGESYKTHVKKYGEKDTTIERIDVNGNYCKENCTRKTRKEQINNQRTNTIVVINGEQHNLGEWSKILGIPRETLKRHIIYGKIKGEIYRRGTGKMYDYKKNKRGKI